MSGRVAAGERLALVVARALVSGAASVPRVATDLAVSPAVARSVIACAEDVLLRIDGVSVDSTGDCLSVWIDGQCSTCPLVAGTGRG